MVLPSNQNIANPPVQAPAQEPQQGQNGQGYVTREELAQFQDGLKDTLSEWYQGVQSQTDRYQARVQQRLTEFESGIAALKQSGVTLDEAQIEAARNKLVVDTLAKAPEQQQRAQQQEPGEDPQLEAYRNTVTASAERMMRAAGVEISDDDPEVAQYIEPKAEGSVEEYLDGVLAAINAKKERLARGPNVGQIPSLSGGGAPATNNLQNITDPSSLWQEAMRQGKIR